MDDPIMEPHRCPKCSALVVDRRFANCTTCRAALPADWVMSSVQANKVNAQDRAARAEFKSEMNQLDPSANPDLPMWLRVLDSDYYGGGI